MNICIIITHFPPACLGGAEIASYHMAEHLAHLGHDVHVITSLDEGPCEENCKKGIFIHRLARSKIRIISSVAFYYKIVRKVRMIRPDVIHVQGLGNGVPALLSNWLLGMPYAIYGRGSDVYFSDWFTKLTSRFILKKASAVIALTEHMKVAMQMICNRDIVVIPNGIDIWEDTNKDNREADNKIILSVGRLYNVKGTQYLLAAMNKVHLELPEAKLIIVGDGVERTKLEKLTNELGIQSCVEFIGKVPHDNIPEYMNKASIFVLPSLSEGFPVTVLEAMACGLPIIATRVGGLPDIVEEKVNGYLVEAKQIDELADKILMLLRNNYLRKEISARNRVKARMYTWDKVAENIEELYQEMINDNKDGNRKKRSKCKD